MAARGTAFVIAIHEIEDPVAFRRAASSTAELPDGLRLHRVCPLVNGVKAVCLWEGKSADAVGDHVDSIVGDCNRTEFYEVDRASALGLPRAWPEQSWSARQRRPTTEEGK